MTEDSTEIALTYAPVDDLVAIVTEPLKFADLLAKIRAEMAEAKVDTSTDKGRKAIASRAYKVARTKTALDAAGKDLNAGLRKQIDAVDEYRRGIRSELDKLAEEVRRPLTDWEVAEEERKRIVVGTINAINQLVRFDGELTSDEIRQRQFGLSEITLDADVFGDDLEAAIKAKAACIEQLDRLLPIAIKREDEAKELERLRAEAEERRIADETAERERQEKIEAERAEAEKAELEAEAERLRQKDIAEAAERAATEAREKAEREAQEKQDAADREAQQRIRDAEAEAERLREDQRKRDEAAAADEEDRKRREADHAHKSSVMRAAKEAIMEHGILEHDARTLVLAIKAGEIPNVKLEF